MSLLKSKKWTWYNLPSQITAQGLCTVIPLYVIFLGGDIREIAIITALQNGAVACGSIFWGKIIDRFHIKRAVLIISFFFILLCSTWFFFTKSINTFYVISPILGFFLSGRNPVTQLLVMESVQKNYWSQLFARTSTIGTFGMFVSMIVGTIWSVYFDLRSYFLICSISSGIALAISLTIKESHFHLELSSIAHSIHGLRYSFSHFHFVFPKVLELYDYRHITTLFKGKISNEIGIFFLSTFFFYFGSNIYFTAFTPFLKSLNFSNSSVFLIYMIQTAIMMSVFFVAPKWIAKMGEEHATLISYVPRISAVVVAGLFIPFMLGNVSFVIAIISACLMVVAFSIFSTSSSVIFFKSIPQGFEGKYLGVNSSVTGIGVFGGALATGELTNLFGYTVSYLVSSAILVLSFILFKAYFHYKLSHKIV